LHFVEEQKDRLPFLGQFVEGLFQHARFEPAGHLQDRVRDAPQGRDLVELDPKQALRVDVFLVQQVLDHLLLQGGLADLARASQHRHRRETALQALQHRVEQPACVRWERSRWFSLPPGVRVEQKTLHRCGQARTARRVFVSVARHRSLQQTRWDRDPALPRVQVGPVPSRF